jgi:GT2 family glycosyltransferase
MKTYPKVSIIVPLYVMVPRFLEDLKRFSKLNYSHYEIIVVSDKKFRIETPKVKFLLTGKKRTGPAEKRDIAIKKATGEICAFIDDDAYPHRDWLKNAVVHFQNNQIAAVSGPGLTPPEDKYWEQVTGLVYSSFFCGGFAQYRFVKGKMKFVEDYPAYNLIVRKDVLKKIGGYGNHFYGGEDTFLCLKIIKRGYKIIYDPEVDVFHHRRALFLPYLKQIANIGLHRGYFAKKYPETSRKVFYFFPSLVMLIFFLLLAGSFVSWKILFTFIILISFSLVVFVLSVIEMTDIYTSLIVSFGIISTHIVYGYAFIKGLLTNDLEK